MPVLLRWMGGLLSGIAAFFGALLVGWHSIAVYYLVTGRVEPGSEQPPLAIVVPALILGLILLFGGWKLHRWLKRGTPF